MSLCCSENIFKEMVHSKLFSLRFSQMSKQKDLSIESICVFFSSCSLIRVPWVNWTLLCSISWGYMQFTAIG